MTAQRDGDERAIIQPFQRTFPCVRVSIISVVTGRLYERIQTESRAGRAAADVVLTTDEALTQRMIDDKLLRPWNPPSADAYPPNTRQEG